MCTREKEFTIQRHRGLPGARLRPHRLLRGRHRRAAVLDGAAHRIGRPGADDSRCNRAFRCCTDAAGRREASRQCPAVAKPELMRRLRRTKIVATLGPASSDRTVIASLFQRRRRRLPHQHEPHHARAHARAGGCDPRGRGRERPADRHPGRSAGSQAARRQLRRRRGHAGEGRQLRARCRSGAGRRAHACTCRTRKSSPRSSPAIRCCSTTARSG